MTALLHWVLDYWFLFFLLGALGVYKSIRDFLVNTWNMIAGARHSRRLEKLNAQATLERARAGADRTAPRPGPCAHRNVVPVISTADELVARLCRSCDTKLDANWAVREEDL
jgi:hypothetical protein